MFFPPPEIDDTRCQGWRNFATPLALVTITAYSLNSEIFKALFRRESETTVSPLVLLSERFGALKKWRVGLGF